MKKAIFTLVIVLTVTQPARASAAGLEWLTALIPVADTLYQDIKDFLGSGKKKEQARKKLEKKFTEAFESSISGLDQDISIVGSFRPIIARLQAIEDINNSYRYLIGYRHPYRAVTTLELEKMSKRYGKLLVEAQSIESTLAKATQESGIDWKSGKVSLTNEIRDVSQTLAEIQTISSSLVCFRKGLEALEAGKSAEPCEEVIVDPLLQDADYYSDRFDANMGSLETNLRKVNRDASDVYAYWDEFLSSTVANLQASREKYAAAVGKEIATITIPEQSKTLATILGEVKQTVLAD